MTGMTDNVRRSSTARPAGRDDLDGLARLLLAGTRSVPLYRRAGFEPSPVLLHRARPQE
jgi:hypothetical protein